MSAGALSAAEFSSGLTREEFASAGLGKLTPAELARLDALVRARIGADVGRERAAAVAQMRAETPAPEPESKPGLLRRMRVVLTPGTQIDYERVETQLAGSFRGYDPGKVLTLANGQRWRVVEGRYWSPARDADKPRKVVIEPGAFGSFFLEIEDGGRPKVEFAGSE